MENTEPTIQIETLSKDALLTILPNDLPEDISVIQDALTAAQFQDFSKEEVFRLNVKLKNALPEETTYALIVKELVGEIVKDEYDGLLAIDILEKLNSPRPVDDCVENNRRPIWYDLVAGIPGAPNLCTIEFVVLALGGQDAQ